MIKSIWAPIVGNQFRVNAPGTAEGRFKDRWEAKSDGVLAVTVSDTDLQHAESAELYLELWGGHPRTSRKRFTLNDQVELALPEVGAADNHCVYSYPSIPLPTDKLRPGDNRLAFTCDAGGSFWGHYLIRSAAVRMRLRPTHPDAALAVAATPQLVAKSVGDQRIELSLDPGRLTGRIDRVDYVGHYNGFDENGDGSTRDWHGFTKDRQPQGIIGSATAPPYVVTWDVSMLPTPRELSVRAEIHLSGTDPAVEHFVRTSPIKVDVAEGAAVRMILPSNLPRPFWSRANQLRRCELHLDFPTDRIERAELHVVIWDGGRGEVAEPVTLNGHPLPVAGRGGHDVLYRVVPVSPEQLNHGMNVFSVLSDTEHHGIEVLLPGPVLMVRLR